MTALFYSRLLLSFALLTSMSQPSYAKEDDDPFWTMSRKLEGAAHYALSTQDRDVTFIINDAPVGYRENLFTKDEAEKAETQLANALEVARSHASESPEELILLLDAHGALYYRCRDYSKAIKYFQESLDLRRSNYGDDSLETAEGNDLLALAARVSGDCNLAVKLYLDSISIRENTPNMDAFTLGESYMRLACAYFDKLDTAKGLEVRAQAYRLAPSLSTSNGRPVATSIFAPPVNGMDKLIALPTKIVDRENIDQAEKIAEQRGLDKLLKTAKAHKH